jgi:hypothetical protein
MFQTIFLAILEYFVLNKGMTRDYFFFYLLRTAICSVSWPVGASFMAYPF